MPVFFTSRRFEIVPVLVVLAALVMRLVVAAQTSFNPDEALIFFIAQASDWYARSLRFHHPPLFYFLLHYIQWISDSELALRLLPIIAGSLFPWVIWKWLARQGFAHAALVALLLLEFSPTLISLSAQVRGYTLALLLSSLALLFLEAALETRSLPRLVLAMLCLYLGILTEFSVAFVAGALGVYAMLRLVKEHHLMSFSLVWVLSQLGALGVYALLYKTSIATLVSDPDTVQHVTGYLRHSFPQPSANRLYFAVAGTAKQFSYALSSMAVGVVGVALFMAGMIFLWRKEDAMRYRILDASKVKSVPNFNFFRVDGTCAFAAVAPNVQIAEPGEYIATCEIPPHFLNDGGYFVGLAMTSFGPLGHTLNFNEQSALSFNVRDPMNADGNRYGYGGPMPGAVRPIFDWKIERLG